MANREKAGPTFRPAREGLAKILGDLEADVMECVWGAAPAAVTARDVEDALGDLRGVQYITLVTVLNNLWKKKLLKRKRFGRAFAYQAKIEREEYLRQISRDVFAGIVDLGPELAVSSFVDVLADMGPKEIERLKKKLAEHSRREKRK